MRGWIWMGAFYLVGLSANAFSAPHYLAPATGLLYAVLLQSMRHVRVWRPGREPAGRFLVRTVPALCVLLTLPYLLSIASTRQAELPRWRVQHQLEQLPGRQIAFVRYATGHNPMDEWVYNSANIDSAKVVWARTMSAAEDRDLINYFGDARAWLVEPNGVSPKVAPYSPSKGENDDHARSWNAPARAGLPQ